MPAATARVSTHGDVTRLTLTRRLAGRPFISVTCHVIGGVLVDSGFPRALREMGAFLDANPVEAVLTTHHHEDHVGGHALALERGLPVHAPPGVISFLAQKPVRIPLYRDLVWGHPVTVTGGIEPVVSERLEVADRRFRVVPVPGHAADHVAYVDEDSGACFCGDVFVPRLRSTRPVENVATWIRSLERLRSVEPTTLYPSHGRPVEEPDAALADAVDRLKDLRDRARELHTEGRSLAGIRRELLGRERSITYVSLGDFSSKNLVRSLVRDEPEAPRVFETPSL